MPYYDIILDDDLKSNLVEIPMSALIADRVMNINLTNLMNNDKNQTTQLIQFVPKKSDKSEILNDYQIDSLIQHFPSLFKTMDWELVFSLNRDGVSALTFFEKCKNFRTTLVVV